MDRQILDAEGKKQFDARVHIKNKKGQLSDIRPYRRFFDGPREYNMDVKTGYFFFPNGDRMFKKDLPDGLKALAASEEVTQVKASSAPVKQEIQAKRGRPAKQELKPMDPEDQEPNPEPILGDAVSNDLTSGL